MAEELEEAAKHGQLRDFWPEIRGLTKGKTKQMCAVRDKNGELIPDPEAQSVRLAEYSEELLSHGDDMILRTSHSLMMKNCYIASLAHIQ